MKDKYTLITYKPETYIRACARGCCGGTTYDHEFEQFYMTDLDELAREIVKCAIDNTERGEIDGEKLYGWGIWITRNGRYIIGNPNDEDGYNPCDKLESANHYEWDAYNDEFDEGFNEEENKQEGIEMEKDTQCCKYLDEKIEVLWRKDAEVKKEKERIKKEADEKKELEKKKEAEKKKEENERKRLRELVRKYPEEV